ncbi:MAG: cupredoxin domain-containing protein [Candidatus Taylorbacteria bacterium]|nr:cupredoxin domain-containing protein [Candidatus Taylorbacteria bacterium]
MKFLTYSILTVIIFFGAAYFFVNGANGSRAGVNTTDSALGTANNVSIENGVQIIEIQARGGYEPRSSVAKAGIPTIIRFNTNGAFDCSTSVRIPSLGINKILPRTGTTDVDIGSPQATTLKGSCSMGMYRFEIDFRNY